MRDVFWIPLMFTHTYLFFKRFHGEFLPLVELLLFTFIPLVYRAEIPYDAGVNFDWNLLVRHKKLLRG
jgi:hypothetical protein